MLDNFFFPPTDPFHAMVNKMRTRICAAQRRQRQAKRVRRRTHCRRHEPNHDALRSIDRSTAIEYPPIVRVVRSRRSIRVPKFHRCFDRSPSSHLVALVLRRATTLNGAFTRCRGESIRIEYVRTSDREMKEERRTAFPLSTTRLRNESMHEVRGRSDPAERSVIRTAVERINISSTDFKLRLPAATRFQTLPPRLLMPVRE